MVSLPVKWLLRNMAQLGVPESMLPILGTLKALGAAGLLVGIGAPLLGILAAAGLTLFFIATLITHLRAHDLSLGNGVPVIFLVLVVTTLVLGIPANAISPSPTGFERRLGRKEWQFRLTFIFCW